MAKVAATGQPPDSEFVPLAVDTLAGDLRDFLLDRLRNDHSAIPWQMRPEAEQRDVVAATERAVRRVLTLACRLIAAAGWPSAGGSIDRLVVKDDLQLQISVGKDDTARHLLMDRVQRPVTLILADVSTFLGERAPAPVKPDQGDIIDMAAE